MEGKLEEVTPKKAERLKKRKPSIKAKSYDRL